MVRADVFALIKPNAVIATPAVLVGFAEVDAEYIRFAHSRRKPFFAFLLEMFYKLFA
jgi:hypothetical protein